VGLGALATNNVANVEAHRAGFYLTGLRMVAPASDSIIAAPEIGWYAETGVEVALAASDYERARSWATFGSAVGGPGSGSLSHWLSLIDIADSKSTADRDTSLSYVEELAVHGRLDPTLLHRLATVLDALEYNVLIHRSRKRHAASPAAFFPRRAFSRSCRTPPRSASSGERCCWR
jgi:hypothetical protein